MIASLGGQRKREARKRVSEGARSNEEEAREQRRNEEATEKRRSAQRSAGRRGEEEEKTQERKTKVTMIDDESHFPYHILHSDYKSR